MKVYYNLVQHLLGLRTFFLVIFIAPFYSASLAQMNTGENDEPKQIFLRASVSKSSCVVGETIIVTYKLFSAIQAKSEILQLPRFSGFTTAAIDEIESINPGSKLINGQLFQVYEIKKLLLTPVVAGKLVVDPMEMEHVIISQGHQIPGESQTGTVGDLLDQLTDAQESQIKPGKIKSYSNQLQIVVAELPVLEPGSTKKTSVGNFVVYTKIKSKKVFADESFVVTVTVKGRGNLSFVDPPEINFPKGTNVIAVQESENEAARSTSLNTVHSFDYTISTNQLGTFDISSVEFTYFDPSAYAFKTTKSNPLKVLVEAGRQPEKIQATAKTATLQPTISTAVRRQWKISGYQIILLLMITVILVIITTSLVRKIRMTEGNALTGAKSGGWRASKAIRVDRDTSRLGKLQKMFDSNDFKMFYHELYSMIWQSVSEKLNVRPIEQYKRNILALLRSSGWKNEEIAELDDILDRCAWNLYVPDTENNKSYTEIYERSRRILQRLEQDSSIVA